MGDTLQSLANDGQGVFGGKEKDFAGARNRELAQAGGAGGNTHRHIQGEEAFAAFGFAAQDADGLVGPKALDQPLDLSSGGGELGGALDGERIRKSRSTSTSLGRVRR